MAKIMALPDVAQGEGSMDAKVLLLIALLAPILMLAAGIFVGRKNKTEDLKEAELQPPAMF